MALIPDVKCSRCDRLYSGLHSKCPYCGARRAKKGKRVSQNDNSTLKLVIGILLLVVLAAAVVILVVQSFGSSPSNSSSQNSSSISSSSSEQISSSESSSSSSESSSSSTNALKSISLTYLGKPLTHNDITMKIGDTLPLAYTTTPADATGAAVWTSSNTAIFTVSQDGKLVAVSKGEANLTVAIGDISVKCVVRVS